MSSYCTRNSCDDRRYTTFESLVVLSSRMFRLVFQLDKDHEHTLLLIPFRGVNDIEWVVGANGEGGQRDWETEAIVEVIDILGIGGCTIRGVVCSLGEIQGVTSLNGPGVLACDRSLMAKTRIWYDENQSPFFTIARRTNPRNHDSTRRRLISYHKQTSRFCSRA